MTTMQFQKNKYGKTSNGEPYELLDYEPRLVCGATKYQLVGYLYRFTGRTKVRWNLQGKCMTNLLGDSIQIKT